VLNKTPSYPRPTGLWLHPGQGWNGIISEERAVRELVDVFDEELRQANILHPGSSYGMTPFQWGNRTDWGNFNHEPLTLKLVAALRVKYSAN